MLKQWLSSYQPEHLFDESAGTIIRPEVLEILPEDPHKRLGQTKFAIMDPVKLNLPADWTTLCKGAGESMSPMRGIGTYLDEVVRNNPHDFRIFSPDEVRFESRTSRVTSTDPLHSFVLTSLTPFWISPTVTCQFPASLSQA